MSKTSDSNPSLVPASAIKPARPELEAVRKELAEAKGPKFWRSLEELSGKHEAAFGELLEREFPRQHSEWLDPVSRRNFLKLAGASMALAGLAGCTKQPLEQILPYVRQPEELIPGKPIFYATAMPFAGYGLPLLVETHEFRPTKVEGNPDHACSLGATDLFAQASILGLYDPDRSTVLSYKGEARPWGEFLGAMRGRVEYHKANQGAGLRFLTGAVSSPTFGSQMKAILQIFPQAKWHRWDPVHRDGTRAGSKLAFGAQYDPQYKFAAADVVVSLDADFLSGSWFPGFVRYARDFMSRRQRADENMNRFYAAESSPTTTGAKADHRLVLRHSQVEIVAHALAAKIGVPGVPAVSDIQVGSVAGYIRLGPVLSAEEKKWVDAVAADLEKHRGKSLVVPGEFQSATVNALAHAINDRLGNVGQTVTYTDPVEIDAVEHTQSIRELADDLNAGKVETLIMVGGNPVYDAPVDLKFQAGLEKLIADAAQRERDGGQLPPQRIIQLSLYDNDTSPFCHWHVPEAHYLESWGDVRAVDGTASIIQPMIAPLYDGKSGYEILAIFTDQPGTSGYDLLQAYWRSQHTGDDFNQWWRKSVHDGYIAGSKFPTRAVTLKLGALPEPKTAFMVGSGGEVVEVMFRPDPTIYDGTFINNGWLQETPKPLTRTTWDNVVMISPDMARRMGLSEIEGESIAKSDIDKDVNKDHQSDEQRLMEINLGGRKVIAPAWTQPGHPDHAVTLFLGYGRKKSGRIGMAEKNTPRGYDAYAARAVTAQYAAAGTVKPTVTVIVEKDGRQEHEEQIQSYPIAVTQGHFTMDDREPVRVATLEEYLKNPKVVHENAEEPPKPGESLYPNFADKGFYQRYAWGMAIDLNSCVGCQACSVACYAENNISIVGKEQVQRGREMGWIRIDAYYQGDPANPNIYFQPVPCMQCENAPCEPVCPVAATTHSTEGLNDMVYNRCVGTRYCSNNCPYKVRRFNFLLFANSFDYYDAPSLKLGRNPDVTVRSRGVMEKCTYCVQRINAARITAEKQNRDIGEKDILTACQQVCPTGAIVFGNILDPNSRVSKLKDGQRNYSLLAELNTRPRTTYIAAVRNPNPALEVPEKA